MTEGNKARATYQSIPPILQVCLGFCISIIWAAVWLPAAVEYDYFKHRLVDPTAPMWFLLGVFGIFGFGRWLLKIMIDVEDMYLEYYKVRERMIHMTNAANRSR